MGAGALDVQAAANNEAAAARMASLMNFMALVWLLLLFRDPIGKRTDRNLHFFPELARIIVNNS